MILSPKIRSSCIGLIFSTLFTMPVLAESLNCPCKVVRVLNGDTVYVLDQYRSSRKIWLAGIDAPTIDQMYGERSRTNLVNLVVNQYVEVEFMQRDRYGRILGKLLKGGRDMNLQQIKDGYAKHYKLSKDEQSAEDRSIYSTAEAKAKLQHIGLWSLTQAYPESQIH